MSIFSYHTMSASCSGANVRLRETTVENRDAALGDHVHRVHGRAARRRAEQPEAGVHTSRVLPAELNVPLQLRRTRRRRSSRHGSVEVAS